MRPTILLTRPEDGAERFVQQLRDRFGDIPVVFSPLLRIEPSGSQPDLTPYRGVIVTSANGVPNGGIGVPCHVVGQTTAQAARAAGLDVQTVEIDAQALIQRILADRVAGPLLHLRGEHARGDIALTLTAAGIQTDEAVVYAQKECPLTPEAQAVLHGKSPVLVPLFSPRTARIFAAQRPQAPLVIAAMSPAVVQALGDMPVKLLEIAATPDANAMLDATQRLIDALA